MIVFVSKFKGNKKISTKIFSIPFLHQDIKNGKIFLLRKGYRSEKFEDEGEFSYKIFFSFDNSLSVKMERTENGEMTDIFVFDNIWSFFLEEEQEYKAYHVSNEVRDEVFREEEGVEYSAVVNHQDSQFLF